MCLSWEGQDTMEETAMGADTWVGPEYRKKRMDPCSLRRKIKGELSYPAQVGEWASEGCFISR